MRFTESVREALVLHHHFQGTSESAKLTMSRSMTPSAQLTPILDCRV
jgi:hypothetical protein